MTIKKFFLGRAFVSVCILVILFGFFVYKNYVYKSQKVDDTKNVEEVINTNPPVFTWKYEKANVLNLDGINKTNIYLEVKYSSGIVENKLIDTTDSSCNDLPDNESDSVMFSTTAQCYGAGLGYTFKVVKSDQSYKVMRKKFEEGVPDVKPTSYKYEVVAEFDLNK